VPKKRNLSCPCGEAIQGEDETELVKLTREHLRVQHPGMEYTDEEILFIAY